MFFISGVSNRVAARSRSIQLESSATEAQLVLGSEHEFGLGFELQFELGFKFHYELEIEFGYELELKFQCELEFFLFISYVFSSPASTCRLGKSKFMFFYNFFNVHLPRCPRVVLGITFMVQIVCDYNFFSVFTPPGPHPGAKSEPRGARNAPRGARPGRG